MNNFGKWTVVITWLSSWVGAGFAREFAEKWYDLLLIARNKEKTETFIKYLHVLYPNIKISYKIFDFSKKHELKKLEKEITNIQHIDTLINCIWYTSHKYFTSKKVKTPKDILTPHDIAAMEISHTVFKKMQKEKYGNIIHVTSLLSLFAIADDPLSATSKIFLNTHSQNLHHISTGYNISIQTLCPRFTDIDFGKATNLAFKDKALCVKNVIKKSMHCKKEWYLVCIRGFGNTCVLTLYHILPKKRSHQIFRRLVR